VLVNFVTVPSADFTERGHFDPAAACQRFAERTTCALLRPLFNGASKPFFRANRRAIDVWHTGGALFAQAGLSLSVSAWLNRAASCREAP
jgi:hypothetical protein